MDPIQKFLFVDSANWYMRIVQEEPGRGGVAKVMDFTNNVLTSAPSARADTLKTLTYNNTAEGYEVRVPLHAEKDGLGLPPGHYAVCFFNAAVPALGDAKEVVWLMEWNGVTILRCVNV